MTCLDCGGAGILLDFDNSTYGPCHCREQIAENANCPAIATEAAPAAETVKLGSVHEGAGRQASPDTSHRSTGE